MFLENDLEIFEYFLEYRSRSLTSTDDEEMLFIGFPGDGVLECWSRRWWDGMQEWKYWVEYLSDGFTFITMEVSLRTFESEKNPSRDLAEKTIRSSGYRIWLMDIERNTEHPCSDTDGDWSGSSLWEDTRSWLVTRDSWLVFQDSSHFQYSINKHKRIQEYFWWSSGSELQCGDRDEWYSIFFCCFFFLGVFSSDPEDVRLLECWSVGVLEILRHWNNRLDMSTCSSSDEDDFTIFRECFCEFLVHNFILQFHLLRRFSRAFRWWSPKYRYWASWWGYHRLRTICMHGFLMPELTL